MLSNNLLAGTPSCPSAIGLEITDYNANPRISSPSANIIGFNDYECVVSAEHAFIDPVTGTFVNGIKVYSNIGGSFGSGNLLNYDPNVTNIIPNSANTFPAITYNSEGKISVAWTYNTTVGGVETDVISVNYELNSNIRTPNDYEYYMLVNQTRADSQYAPSVAGGTRYIASDPVFYTFAGIYNGVYSVVFKTSNTAMQPQIRKKSPNSLENKLSDVLIYPNPTNTNLKLDFSAIDSESEIAVKLISIDGKLVFEKKGTSSTYNKPINVTSFDKGIYILEYQYNDVVKRKKIVIQ